MRSKACSLPLQRGMLMLEPRSKSRHNTGDEFDALLVPSQRQTVSPVYSNRKLVLLVVVACALWLFHGFAIDFQSKFPHHCHTDSLKDNGLTKDVQWDGCSLFIKGQRVFLWSGEIHPWRIPIQSQWLDILQKIKASGMNAISVYAHW